MKSVVIIDDHDIVRFGLEVLLAESGLQVVRSAATLAEGLQAIAQMQPDLVITDMGTGDSQGLETVRRVVAAQAPRHTLVLSMQDEMLYGEQVLALGAAGYVMKESAHALVVPAATAVLSGQTWVSSRLSAQLVKKLTRRGAPAPMDEAFGLTARELEILLLLKTGQSSKQIAKDLRLGVRTVDFHRANIKKKLGLRTGAELIAFASHRL
jgi:DNA-binding NarL/FixJ family response regulator